MISKINNYTSSPSFGAIYVFKRDSLSDRASYCLDKGVNCLQEQNDSDEFVISDKIEKPVPYGKASLEQKDGRYKLSYTPEGCENTYSAEFSKKSDSINYDDTRSSGLVSRWADAAADCDEFICGLMPYFFNKEQ